MLSGAQFKGLAETLNHGEGFTVGPGMSTARSAVMVGGVSGAPEGHVPSPARGSDIAGYAHEHADKLAKPGNFLGGWGQTLDVSTAFPRTEAGTLHAVIQGIHHGEDSVGVVNEHGEYAGEYPTNAGMANPKTTSYQVPKNRDRHGPR